MLIFSKIQEKRKKEMIYLQKKEKDTLMRYQQKIEQLERNLQTKEEALQDL